MEDLREDINIFLKDSLLSELTIYLMKNLLVLWQRFAFNAENDWAHDIIPMYIGNTYIDLRNLSYYILGLEPYSFVQICHFDQTKIIPIIGYRSGKFAFVCKRHL